MTSAPNLLSAGTLTGDDVVNAAGEKLGRLEELMLDLDRGRIAYAVVSFGGFMGMGDKLFAVPWQALRVDGRNKRVVLDVAKERLENAPGFDPEDWPETDIAWSEEVHSYYGYRPYWEDEAETRVEVDDRDASRT